MGFPENFENSIHKFLEAMSRLPVINELLGILGIAIASTKSGAQSSEDGPKE